jgi:hypothetical protein
MRASINRRGASSTDAANQAPRAGGEPNAIR